MKSKILLVIATTFIFTSCEDLPFEGLWGRDIENLDARYEYSLSKNFTQQFKTLYSETDEYTVYAASDFHIDETIQSVNQPVFLQAVNDDETAVCCLTVGDLVHDGREKSYQNYVDGLSQFPEIKVAASIGNHDLYFGGWQHFKNYFGCSMYYFEIVTPNHKDLFICLDSGSGTHGGKQIAWLKNLFAQIRNDYRNCIVFTHSNLTSRNKLIDSASNLLIEELYALFHLFSSNNVALVLSGHIHFYDDATVQGVRYVTLDLAKDDGQNSSYLKINCSNTISSDVIKF
jgi:predicted MPP superfamily phosphohydrolase